MNCSAARVLDSYPSLTYSKEVVTFIETPLFTRLIGKYLTDQQYLELQTALSANPEAGAIIPSGGVRKIRWAMAGRGKRGGLRVIYYVRTHRSVIWMLTLYPKNVRDTISAHVLRKMRKELENAN